VTLITVRLATKIQPRYLIGVGSVLFSIAMFYFHSVTLTTGPDQLLWPMITSGAALGMLVVPLSMAALGSLRPQEVPDGAGLFNLMRQLGGSVGIAASATLLDHWNNQARAPLSLNFNPYNPAFQERLGQLTTYLQSRGAPESTAHDQALAILDRTLSLQSSLLRMKKPISRWEWCSFSRCRSCFCSRK
jgi:DHA2 family multidrug resistance protein